MKDLKNREAVHAYHQFHEELVMRVNIIRKAGRYKVNFNTSKLSSGVYVYRMEASNFKALKKLMLIK